MCRKLIGLPLELPPALAELPPALAELPPALAELPPALAGGLQIIVINPGL